MADYDNRNRYIPDDLREFVIRRDRWRCRYCGRSLRFTDWECDHVWPISLEGLTVADNLVASCRECNRKKSDKLGIYPKPPEYWYLLGRSKAVSFPFLALALVLVGVWGATISLVWAGSHVGAQASGGLILTGLAAIYGWTKRGETR
jgi:hypothetical protein